MLIGMLRLHEAIREANGLIPLCMTRQDGTGVRIPHSKAHALVTAVTAFLRPWFPPSSSSHLLFPQLLHSNPGPAYSQSPLHASQFPWGSVTFLDGQSW
jgi:hypothetical protein